MKALCVALIFICLSIFPLACGSVNNNPLGAFGHAVSPTSTVTITPTFTVTGTPTVTPTVTPPPTAAVTVSADCSGGCHYTDTAVTILAGQSVMWDTSNAGHPLNVDDGSGACQVSSQFSFPYTVTFSSAGTYPFHCGVHSTCGNGSCPSPSTCTGMVGTITVN